MVQWTGMAIGKTAKGWVQGVALGAMVASSPAAQRTERPEETQATAADTPVPAFAQAGTSEEDEEAYAQADARSLLRANQQRALVAQRSQAEEQARSAVADELLNKYASPKEAVNQALAKITGATVLAFVFLYWPVKLVLELATNGKLARVSWDDIFPEASAVLPNSAAKAVAAFGLVTDALLGSVLLAALFIFAYLVASFVTDPGATLHGALSSFGMIADIIVDFVLH